VDKVRRAGIIRGGLALTDATSLVTVLVRHLLGVRSACGGHHASALVATRAQFFATIRSVTPMAGPPSARSRTSSCSAQHRGQEGTTTGAKHGATNVRKRILAPAVDQANERLS
jgi:hypothetical protein